ncbi:hypothetical protein [Stutzerimonas stutzeri]|uniref:hypothetical protein n=1 Tax=Stutzerimonas stutzeri TaxID=316 RepID=UPI0011AEEE1F|nr:hypothetical protein [Stutzerimonas stutzeri]MCQ4256368.1 hypothetical protein [Stutzerimonas stutzeri]
MEDRVEVCSLSRQMMFQSVFTPLQGDLRFFPHSFTRSINSLLYSSPAEVGNATGLPCSAWISERVGLLDFAGGTTSTRGYR